MAIVLAWILGVLGCVLVAPGSWASTAMTFEEATQAAEVLMDHDAVVARPALAVRLPRPAWMPMRVAVWVAPAEMPVRSRDRGRWSGLSPPDSVAFLLSRGGLRP